MRPKSIDIEPSRRLDVDVSEEASVLIGAIEEPVDESARYAQLKPGLRYRFYTGEADTKIYHLAKRSDRRAAWRLEKNRQVRENPLPAKAAKKGARK